MRLSASAEPEPSIIRSTLRALLEPRRLVPVTLVSISLVVAQASFSDDRLAIPLGVAMCALFVVVAPVSWRVLFPHGLDLRHGGVRVLLYGAIGVGVVGSGAIVLPGLLGMGRTLLSSRPSMAVSLALFLVGGWGLARDIWLERNLHRAEALAADLAREAERAQLVALRAHLDPHFLFNTLNAIAEWCREDGETAERALLELAAMLRAVLAGVRAPTWSLGEELALVRALFSLHRLRDPHRFRLAWQVPEPPPEVLLPPMLLLPLAENAVKHGPAAGHAGEIGLAVALEGGELVVTIANPGRYRGPRAGASGLEMVERRLALAYDGRGMFRIASEADRTTATVRLPLDGPSAERPV